jgi:hypothetical protein
MTQLDRRCRSTSRSDGNGYAQGMNSSHDGLETPDPDAEMTGSVGDRSQVEVEQRLDEKGFGGQFGAREGARVLCFTCHEEFPAAQLDADRARRVEGESDPADMAILVPAICPNCGAAGTLSLQFGPMSSAEESDVIAALPRIPSSFDPVDGAERR